MMRNNLDVVAYIFIHFAMHQILVGDHGISSGSTDFLIVISVSFDAYVLMIFVIYGVLFCPFHGKRYELGRQPAMTKLSSNKTVRRVRVRGGNVKWRALRLDTGNYSWGSEAVTRKTRILDVVYNASNNELVRTQTLVKSAIVQVDAAPFKQWYLQHYGVDIGRKKKAAAAAKKETEVI